jgi:hypothetical protein
MALPWQQAEAPSITKKRSDKRPSTADAILLPSNASFLSVSGNGGCGAKPEACDLKLGFCSAPKAVIRHVTYKRLKTAKADVQDSPKSRTKGCPTPFSNGSMGGASV